MKTHKVGADALFTRRQMSTITPTSSHRVIWILTAVTVSFFISQSLLLFMGN